MIDLIKNKTIDEAKNLVDIFLKLIRKTNLSETEKNLLGDAMALENISNLPGRVRCATLPWYTLKDIEHNINK